MNISFKVHRSNLRDIFLNKNLNKLKEYITKYELNLKDLNNTKYDVLISAIDCNVTLDIMNYIINQVQYKDFNYSVNNDYYYRYDSHIVNVPLFVAISGNHFEISNFLLTKKADINYCNSNIIYILLRQGKLNVKNLRYILNNGFDIKEINSKLIHNFLEFGNAKLLNYLFGRHTFNNQFIINLLNIYKNKSTLTNIELYSILDKEKNKHIAIDESMYEKLINLGTFRIDFKCMDILFKYDSSNPADLLYRINKFKLLNFAIKNNSHFLIKEIIKLGTYDNFNSILNQSFSNFNNDANTETMKFVISNLLEFIFKIKQKKFLKYRKIKLLEVSTNLCGTSLMNLLINKVIRLKNLTLVMHIIENEEYQDLIDINTKDTNGEYPIFVSLTGNVDIFKYLVEKGADYNIKDKNGNSVISLALATNSSISNYLLEISNIKIKHSKKFLFEAIGMGDSNMKNVMLLVKYRLTHHLNRRIKNTNGETPLTFSYKLGYKKIFEFLVYYFDVNETDNKKFSPLYYTIKQDDDEMTKYLIDMGANVNFTDSQGNTVLHMAIENKQTKIISILLDNSCVNVNKANYSGSTPLITLIKNNKFNIKDAEKIINKLIERGSNINNTDNLGNSALFYITQGTLSSLTILLIRKGAKVNIKNTNGYSPLDYALKAQKYNAALDLCQFGCKTFIKKNITFTLLSKLVIENQLELFKYFFIKVGYDLYKKDSEIKYLQKCVCGKHNFEKFLKEYELLIKVKKKKKIHFISTDDNSNNENNNNTDNKKRKKESLNDKNLK